MGKNRVAENSNGKWIDFRSSAGVYGLLWLSMALSD
ncbi:Fe2OG dioxygenase domain-containing protein [Psidium guajava]|nr:Fe2OG dioxygenase domain-containing protein [Psidium guajava]